jgi:hypothetical protein
MGLDMYAFSVNAADAVDDFEYKDDSTREEMHYWRKHNALHAWMEALYRRKGGDAPTFNCVYVRLTLEDLLELIKDIQNKALIPTAGFFFGSLHYYDDDYASSDIEFAHKAIAEISLGNAVYYTSWW